MFPQKANNPYKMIAKKQQLHLLQICVYNVGDFQLTSTYTSTEG